MHAAPRSHGMLWATADVPNGTLGTEFHPKVATAMHDERTLPKLPEPAPWPPTKPAPKPSPMRIRLLPSLSSPELHQRQLGSRPGSREGPSLEAVEAAERRMLDYLAERMPGGNKTMQREKKQRPSLSISMQSSQGLSREELWEIQRMHAEVDESLLDIWEAAPGVSSASTSKSRGGTTGTNPPGAVPTPLSEAAALEVMREMKPCASLRHEELTALLGTATRRLYPRYCYLMREGALGSCVFLVLSGQVDVYRSQIERREMRARSSAAARDADGSGGSTASSTASGAASGGAASSSGDIDAILQSMGPGDVVGESGLLVMSSRRERTVVTTEPTEVLCISASQLAALHQPRFAAHYRISAAQVASKLKRGVQVRAVCESRSWLRAYVLPVTVWTPIAHSAGHVRALGVVRV